MSEVLYRKHRPKTFGDLYGQDHVKTILSQSIENDRVAHAYLFSGPRGSGKTTVARILAKELGIKGVDVVEVDAASHRGIDDIRDLRDSVQFQPTQGSRKMYILDEVHMLTNEAFNALLKTLEEPPAHAYFVLCTTEPHKVPATIISRSVQLPFKRATLEQLVSYISHFAEIENLRLEGDSVRLLAEYADGAFRDAMVLLEKVISLNITGSISPVAIVDGLGFASGKWTTILMEKIEQKDVKGFLSSIESISRENGDLVEITNKLLDRLSFDIIEHATDSKSNNSDLLNHKTNVLKALISAREDMSVIKDPRVALVAHMVQVLSVRSVSASSFTDPTDLKESEHEHHEYGTNDTSQSDYGSSSESNVDEGTHNAYAEPVENNNLSEWDNVLAVVKEKNSTVEALLKEATVSSVSEKDIVIEFPFAFHKSKVEASENMAIVREALHKVYERKLVVKCMLKVDDGSRTPISHDDSAPPPKKVSSDDLLVQAQEVFGGQMIE